MARSKKSKSKSRDENEWTVTGPGISGPEALTASNIPVGEASDKDDVSERKSARKRTSRRDARRDHSPSPFPSHLPSPSSAAFAANEDGSGTMAGRAPLLILSLGNPGASYLHTPHSAGHILLSALSSSPSSSPSWTLRKSASYMNVSGPWVAKEILSFASRLPNGARLPVALLHDSLELAPAELKFHAMAKSAAGHNGLKSVKEHLPQVERKLRARGVELVVRRLAVGIGRPVSRDEKVVSDYVLRKMGSGEVARIQGLAERAERMLGEWVAEEDEKSAG